MLAETVSIDAGTLTPIVLAVISGYGALGGVVIWLLKTMSAQLDRTNTQFIGALQTTVAESNKSSVMMVERLTETVTTLREMAATNRTEHQALSTSMAEQNRAMLDALGKVGRNNNAPSHSEETHTAHS